MNCASTILSSSINNNTESCDSFTASRTCSAEIRISNFNRTNSNRKKSVGIKFNRLSARVNSEKTKSALPRPQTWTLGAHRSLSWSGPQKGFFLKPKSKKEVENRSLTPPHQQHQLQQPKNQLFLPPQEQQQQKQHQLQHCNHNNTNATTIHTLSVEAPITTSRIQLAPEWEKVNDTKTTQALQLLIEWGLITSYKMLHSNTTTTPQVTNRPISPSYLVVATGVDLEISDEMFLQQLREQNFTIRFCKRIISRQRDRPTLMVRLITGDVNTYERLMGERSVHFLGRVFKITESKPPTPIPAPCGRCGLFNHRREDCRETIKCGRCQGPHPTISCESPLPVKCAACNAEDHAAWSLRCPKRPTVPIEGIPTVKIKCLNKRAAEMSILITAQGRVHSPITTTHDYIINKYKHQLNKTTNTNREELLKEMGKQFDDDFNIDTSWSFLALIYTYL
ncbi:uncharacterized protein LOC109543862 isoform X1 [Dendroctonus ponderosae]|uniref:uncharacterized protein LOC109543862 isoform X1 n=1 Tax=Dendroctonus ponderosae TaxID=77166 RepID=UPI0020365907|nr:uncharacterized protein LOC109543862 isoform X1 [Dendroctonus ponderosae]XP_048523561.1 uncharacterized protein LOC109543862 isoform X1 [Dendroctonus ponderosae]XP_048523562.1 uncharacterized protein LOC109543862 isoform X1 [Dendroctonus ponderosae]